MSTTFLRQNKGRDIDSFARIVHGWLARVSGLTMDSDPTPISKFKASYGAVLDDVNRGRVQVITQGGKRYLLMSEDQVIAIASTSQSPRSLGEAARGLVSPDRPLDPKNLHVKAPKSRQFSLPGDRG